MGSVPDFQYNEINSVRKVFKSFNRMLQDSGSAGTFFRLICYLGEGCEMAFGKKAVFSYLTNHVACANVLDAAPFNSFNACFGKRNPNDPIPSLFAKLKGHCFIGVNFACIPLLLQDLKAINLAEIAANIGNKARVFQFLGHLSLITIVKSLLVFGNIFGAIDAAKRLKKMNADIAEMKIKNPKFDPKKDLTEKERFDKRLVCIELAAHVASVAFYALGLVVGISHAPIVALGVIAYGIGVSRSLYNFAYEEEQNWKRAQQEKQAGSRV